MQNPHLIPRKICYGLTYPWAGYAKKRICQVSGEKIKIGTYVYSWKHKLVSIRWNYEINLVYGGN